MDKIFEGFPDVRSKEDNVKKARKRCCLGKNIKLMNSLCNIMMPFHSHTHLPSVCEIQAWKWKYLPVLLFLVQYISCAIYLIGDMMNEFKQVGLLLLLAFGQYTCLEGIYYRYYWWINEVIVAKILGLACQQCI